MSILTDVKLDLLAINLMEDNNVLLKLMPRVLTDLEQDLWGSGINSITIPFINISYKILYGTSANNTITVVDTAIAPINTIVIAKGGNDHVIGGFGDDILLGGTGNDILEGNEGVNTLYGGLGNDELYGNYKDHSGLFIIDLQGATVSLPAFQYNNQYLFGGAGNDTMSGFVGIGGSSISNGTILSLNFDGSTVTSYLDGGDGNDLMAGTCLNTHNFVTDLTLTSASFFSAPTIMDGGNGNDFMVADTVLCTWTFKNATGSALFAQGISTMNGGSGDDTLIGGLGGSRTCIFDGGSISDTELGSTCLLKGEAGNDLLIGDMQACRIQYLNGYSGSCMITFGNSTLIGGAGADKLVGDVQWCGYRYLEDVNGKYVLDVNGKPIIDIAAGSIMDATMNGGDNILFGGTGNDILVGGNEFGGEATNLGHNQFVYDGFINNGNDTILDFHIGVDTLVGQHGATFSDGGIVSGNRVVLVDDAGWSSTITLVGVTDPFASIMQSHAVVV